MNLPDIFKSNINNVKQILKTNNLAEKYGLKLTEQDAHEIIMERERALENQGRVELDIKVTNKIINFLCSSIYINEDNYSDAVIEMQEIFYYLKTETNDKISDNKLLKTIFELYENPCADSLELLKGRESDKIINAVKFNRPNSSNKKEDSDDQ